MIPFKDKAWIVFFTLAPSVNFASALYHIGFGSLPLGIFNFMVAFFNFGVLKLYIVKYNLKPFWYYWFKPNSKFRKEFP